MAEYSVHQHIHTYASVWGAVCVEKSTYLHNCARTVFADVEIFADVYFCKTHSCNKSQHNLGNQTSVSLEKQFARLDSSSNSKLTSGLLFSIAQVRVP